MLSARQSPLLALLFPLDASEVLLLLHGGLVLLQQVLLAGHFVALDHVFDLHTLI